MVIPILMIFLSLALKAEANRWKNIILGIVYVATNLITMLATGGVWVYYYVFAVVVVFFRINCLVYMGGGNESMINQT